MVVIITRRSRLFLSTLLVLGLIVLIACANTQGKSTGTSTNPSIIASPTAFQPNTPTSTPVPSPTPTPYPFTVGFAPSTPAKLIAMTSPSSLVQVVTEGENFQMEVCLGGDLDCQAQVEWVYVLAAPFPTITDGVSISELQAAWRGESAPGEFAGKHLLLSENTLAAFEHAWGKAAPNAVTVLPADELLDAAWASRPSWALVGFEDLEPRWKVLRVDGLSPLDKNLDPGQYALTLHFGWHGDISMLPTLQNDVLLPFSNRDPEKLTVLVMTGVTALTRATGWKMELNGMEYPAGDILPWLKEADLLHISNEVSFNPKCGPADPVQPNLMFCSDPRYIELLDYIGADIIELSGNHNVDRGMDAFIYTLELYRERSWGVYVGGMNIDEARKPLLIENNGTRLAFIGCNLAGPERVWATTETPGEATCDYDYIDQQLADLREEGYLPIFTYQWYESYSPAPSTPQKEDFRARAEAGAVIVQGSQAHRPQGMEFMFGAFIHYGLGNLFFDQMEVDGVSGTRDEFLDRHVFYDGRYISTELLTAMLEDYSRPRPMTSTEREAFLEQMYKVSGW